MLSFEFSYFFCDFMSARKSKVFIRMKGTRGKTTLNSELIELI